MSGTGEEFTCANCGETYTKTWSDEEAMAEMQATWQPIPGDPVVVICDDCFNRITSRAAAEDPSVFTPQRRAELGISLQEVADWPALLPGTEVTDLGGFAMYADGSTRTFAPGEPFDLGITEDELAAEDAYRRSSDEFLRMYWRRRRLGRQRYEPWQRTSLEGETCYRSEYGFTVHVAGTCRCKGGERR